MKDEQRHHIETDLMHGGAEVPGNADRALSPALHMSSTFTFDSIEHAEQVMSFESQDYVYTRGNNPTLRLFEQRMTTLEQGSASIAFASGMAAISSTLLAAAGPKGTVIIHKTLYGSSYTLATTLLPKYGITCITADFTDLAALEQLLAAHPQSVLYFESPCNPDLTILDITKISEAAHRYGSLSIIDNTFASPFLQNPLALGADVTLHSATKYICGHGDALGGVATTRDPELAELIKFGYMCELGGVMSPFNAWLMLRGLKTLHVRMERHCTNAAAAAQLLNSHPKVEQVYYPGLETHPGHALAKEQMRGFGGVISFEVRGGLQAARRCINAFSLAQIAVSLGDCETLVQLPAAMTHRGYDHERLKEFGLTESMIRISVGIEHSDEILGDITRALETI